MTGKKLPSKHEAGASRREEGAPESAHPELQTDRRELMADKSQDLEHFKSAMKEQLGFETLPLEMLREMVFIREIVADSFVEQAYHENLPPQAENAVRQFAARLLSYKESRGAGSDLERGADGRLFLRRGETEPVPLGEAETDLYESLHDYFDAYRLTRNAHEFRGQLKKTTTELAQDTRNRKIILHGEDERQGAVIERLRETYGGAGFSDQELRQLVEFAGKEKLADIDIQEVGLISRLSDVFRRFMGGEKAKYVGLATAMTLPSMLEGAAPNFLASGFAGGAVDLKMIGMYAALRCAGAGSRIAVGGGFQKMLDRIFGKEGGVASQVAGGLGAVRPEDIVRLGSERLLSRATAGKEAVNGLLRRLAFEAWPAAVTVGTSLALLVNRSPALAAGTGAGLGLTMIVNRFLGKKANLWEFQRRKEAAGENLQRRIGQMLQGHMDMVLAGEDESFRDDVEKLLIQEQAAASQAGFREELQNVVNELTGSMNIVGAAVAASVAGGSAENFVAALVTSSAIQSGWGALMRSWRGASREARNLLRMDLTFNGQAEAEAAAEAERVGAGEVRGHGLSLQGVEMAAEGKTLFRGSLDIPEGSVVALTGLSGAGKSTLLKMLAGYYRPTAGEVSLGDRPMADIKRTGSDSLRHKMAYLSQFPYLLEGPIRDNLLYGVRDKDKVSDENLKQTLNEVGLGERFTDLAEKLASGRGDSGSASGGEASRLGLARILLRLRHNDSKILILDEPVASLDPESAALVAEAVRREKERRPELTVIVISHEKQFLDSIGVSREVRLNKGEIMSDDARPAPRQEPRAA